MESERDYSRVRISWGRPYRRYGISEPKATGVDLDSVVKRILAYIELNRDQLEEEAKKRRREEAKQKVISEFKARFKIRENYYYSNKELLPTIKPGDGTGISLRFEDLPPDLARRVLEFYEFERQYFIAPEPEPTPRERRRTGIRIRTEAEETVEVAPPEPAPEPYPGYAQLPEVTQTEDTTESSVTPDDPTYYGPVEQPDRGWRDADQVEMADQIGRNRVDAFAEQIGDPVDVIEAPVLGDVADHTRP
jgi:hypothetical protein